MLLLSPRLIFRTWFKVCFCEEVDMEAKMTVLNPCHEYNFSCTFENFSKQFNPVRSPGFRPIPGCVEEWCLQLEFVDDKKCTATEVLVSVERLSEKHKNYNLHFEISITNICDKRWSRMTSYVENCMQNSSNCITSYSIVARLGTTPKNFKSIFNLPEDKLVLKGKFIISGYDVSGRICEFQSNQDKKYPYTLIEDQKYMYRNSTAFDITFRLHDGVLKAHKCIVMSRSPVFAAMFQHKMLENISKEVPIDDIDTRVFHCFLIFLYTGEIEDKNFETVLALYYVAAKYQVNSLKTACSVILGSSSKLDEDNVCKILVLSDQHSDVELKESAKKVLLNCFSKVSSKSEWLEIVEKSPRLASEVLGFVTKSASR